MSLIDSHIHLFERGYADNRPAGAELEDYQSLRKRYGIDKALVVGFEGDSRFRGNSAYVLNLARDHDWIVPLSFIDPTNASARSVDEAVAAGAAGFSLYLGSDAALAEQVQADVWRAIDKHGSILSVNATPAALAGFGPVIERLGRSEVLISHLGLPGLAAIECSSADSLAPWTPKRLAALTELAKYPQVSVKLTGLYAIDPEFPHRQAEADVRVAMEAFGISRLVWGSDYSPGLGTVTVDQLFSVPDWLSKQLSADEVDDLTGKTMQRILEVS
ncbi:putative TIM-barrel fold metal-dependent hydrolase [Microcella alkaliphila]|uniref:Putative TIM-barrel fold metal-dependent hydrolase n=1 Tax=Microcella alkaliphila TaxID=279828 RepID=A0A4Q7TJ46_9MICO|nr:amidohydrolase family protein [Microcella alkaliphila]RZT60641.1 putative TIM-barrel fold metal-dependent hydrolase [Microcella alkaliphila]